jgi:hypothetical protein
MVRSFVWTNTKRLIVASAVISLVTHAGLITAWVISTLPEPGTMPENSIANKVFYIPPPDRVATNTGSREAVRYVQTPAPGPGTGEGPRMAGEARPVTADQTPGQATKGKDSVSAADAPQTTGPDSVYSVLEVDTAVVRSTKSAAPAYPLKLLEKHIEGYVHARYIVDTTGFADTASFIVLEATHPEFIIAVKEALPYMRFSPAKIGSMKVKQLVQQSFSFKINDTTVVPRRRPPA